MRTPSTWSSTSFMKAQLVGNSQDLQSRFIFCDINGCYGGSTTKADLWQTSSAFSPALQPFHQVQRPDSGEYAPLSNISHDPTIGLADTTFVWKRSMCSLNAAIRVD